MNMCTFMFITGSFSSAMTWDRCARAWMCFICLICCLVVIMCYM